MINQQFCCVGKVILGRALGGRDCEMTTLKTMALQLKQLKRVKQIGFGKWHSRHMPCCAACASTEWWRSGQWKIPVALENNLGALEQVPQTTKFCGRTKVTVQITEVQEHALSTPKNKMKKTQNANFVFLKLWAKMNHFNFQLVFAVSVTHNCLIVHHVTCVCVFKTLSLK